MCSSMLEENKCSFQAASCRRNAAIEAQAARSARQMQFFSHPMKNGGKGTHPTRRRRLLALSGLGDVHDAYFLSHPVFARRSLEALRGLPSLLPSIFWAFLYSPTRKRAPFPVRVAVAVGVTAGRRRGKADGEASCRAGTDHVWKGLLPCCRASERASERAHRLRKRPPFLLSSLLSFPRSRPSTTSCIKSAFSRRHDEGASDWTVDQVKISLKLP